MKFCKKYQEYMQKREIQHLPGVGFKRFKKILKKCREEHQVDSENGVLVSTSSSSSHCPVCNGSFSPALLNEMSAIACCFNNRARKLLELHLATGFQKYLILFRSKFQAKQIALEEGKNLVTYAAINAIAIRKILKKYDKETVFDAVSLTCGHILCYMCACSVASVTIVDGLKAANSKAKCPLCRQGGVYEEAVRLNELNVLLSRSCPEYWKERLRTERAERVQQPKMHWQTVSRSFMGL